MVHCTARSWTCVVAQRYGVLLGIKCLWLNAAIRHLMEMKVNRNPSKSLTGNDDDVEWGTMVFCWWVVCLVDALCCSYFKKKPMLYVVVRYCQ